MTTNSYKYSLKALGGGSILLLAVGIYGSVWGVEASSGQQPSKVSRRFQITGLLKPLFAKRTKAGETTHQKSASEDERSPETPKSRLATPVPIPDAKRFVWFPPSETMAPDDRSISNRIQRLPPIITPPVITTHSLQAPKQEPPAPQFRADGSRHPNQWRADGSRQITTARASGRRQKFQGEATGGNPAPTTKFTFNAPERKPSRPSQSRNSVGPRARANWFEELVTGPGSTRQVRSAEHDKPSARPGDTHRNLPSPSYEHRIAAAPPGAVAKNASKRAEHAGRDLSGFKRSTEAVTKFQAPANPIPTIQYLPATSLGGAADPLVTKGRNDRDTNRVAGRDSQGLGAAGSQPSVENQTERTSALTVDFSLPPLQRRNVAVGLLPNTPFAKPEPAAVEGTGHRQPADQTAKSTMRIAQSAADVPQYSELLGGQFDRAKIIFRPAVPALDHSGRKILRPSVELADLEVNSVVSPTPYMPLLSDLPAELIPGPGQVADDTFFAATQPAWAGPPVRHRHHRHHRRFGRILTWLNVQSAADIGIGRDRLANAPFEIDTTQPMNNYRLRIDAAYDLEFPDRAEYFWAKSTGGDPSVDYQDFRFLMELGGKRFSVGTEIPIRSVDPVDRAGSTGLGDMNLTTKTVMLDGDRWQITQIFRNYFNTGSKTHGTGNGHISLEPGMLFRYKWNDITYLHSEVKYWFPLGGDPDHAGQVLNYGLGMSHLWFDADNFAIIPTLEFVIWKVLDGAQTLGMTEQQLDGLGIFNIYPGVRLVCDKGGDLGLFELGIATGFAVSNNHWYQSLLRVDLRWSY